MREGLIGRRIWEEEKGREKGKVRGLHFFFLSKLSISFIITWIIYQYIQINIKKLYD